MLQYFFLILLTGISGFISGNIDKITGNSNGQEAFLAPWPGVIFGLMLGIWLISTRKTGPITLVGLCLMSGLAYYIAVLSFFRIGDIIPLPDAALYTVAGIIGAAILAGTTFMVKKINFLSIILIITTGGLAGLVFSYYFDTNTCLSFIIWQVAVGLAIGISVNRKQQVASIN